MKRISNCALQLNCLVLGMLVVSLPANAKIYVEYPEEDTDLYVEVVTG